MASRIALHRRGIGLALALVGLAALAAGCGDPAERFNQIGLEAYAARDFTRARAAFEEAISVNPDVGEYYFNRGMCEQALGRFDSAIFNYQMATRLSPRVVRAFEYQAQCYIEMGNPELAQKVLIAGTGANPYTGQAFANAAKFFESRNDLASARLWYAKGVAGDPESAAAHREYALFLARTGDRDKAVEELAKSLELNPLQPDVSAKLTELNPPGDQLPPPKPQTQ
jgi:tetratricopeptide (TPR) repeat protein